jgi:hypothetical protein
MTKEKRMKPKGGIRPGAGRKNKHFDWVLLETLCQRKLTKEHCADKLGVDETTIENRIKEKHGVDFSTFRQRKTANVCLQLVQKGIDIALDGDTQMLRYMLDNFMDFSKKVDHKSTDGSMSPRPSTTVDIKDLSIEELQVLKSVVRKSNPDTMD